MVMEATKTRTIMQAPVRGKVTEKLASVRRSMKPKGLLEVIAAG